MGKKLGLDKQYANIGKGYLQYPVINSVKPKPKPSKLTAGGEMNQMNIKGYMGGGMMKKYSKGMSYKDVAPYGGKYAKIKNDMRDKASENVKRLTTQSSAYDPETRYLVGERRRRNSTTRTVRKTTDQVNLREAANKLKEEVGPGFNVSINTKSDLIRKRLIRPNKKMARKMGGGMMQGYGAARTSGMGLQDESLMPGKMVRAKNGKMLSAKQKKIARMAPPPDKITGADFKAMKAKNGKMVKARFGDFMNTFIADDKRSVAGKSGGADSGTAGEIRSRLGKSDVVEKKKFKNYIKKKVEQGKTVIKKTKETVKKTGKILAIPFKKIDEVAKKNIEENGPVRIYRPRTAVKRYSKGGGMDMGAKKSLTFRQQLTKARADNTRPEDAEKSLTFRQQLAKARAEGTVEKSKTSKYLKKRAMGDKLNALLKTIK